MRTLVVILTLLATGCSGAVQNFVRGAPRPDEPLQQIGGETSARQGLKISTGSVTGVGNTLGVEMTIGPSQQALIGTTIGARVGISQDHAAR